MRQKISSRLRKEVYRRDGYRCALCDGTNGLQIHHVVHRGQGGTNGIQNLITLCSACHSHVHGMPLYDTDMTPEDIEQAIVEYMADYYAPDWNPWKRHPLDD